MITDYRPTQNLEIIKAFKSQTASAERLKGYSGWGGLRKAINSPGIYRELKQVLTAEEIDSLKQTLSSAYFTPAKLVHFMYDWLQVYGFKGGSILEPAVGQGVFLEHMPQAMREKSVITAVEIDRLTSEMVQTLYPNIHHYNIGFETYQPEDKFDLIIGNPPYGSQTLQDVNHPDLNRYCIHHYFVAKCMRLLRPNGILAMVLPSYFLDNTKDHVRYIINREGGSLLAAYRLPDDLFADAKVTVDIVFFTKGKTQNKWLKTNDVTIGDMSKPINEYFYQNSHHILGNLEIIDMYERKGLTCKKRGSLPNLLEHVLTGLKQERLAMLTSSFVEVEQKMLELQSVKQNLFNNAYEMFAFMK